MKNFLRPFRVALFALVLPACAITSPFNQFAYEQATSLKVDALSIMDSAVEPYATHDTEVRQMTIDLKKAFEYAKGRPHNEQSAKQWAIMNDPDRNLLGGFFKRWKEKSTLAATVIDGSKKNVADGFDQIIGLESGKIKTANSKSE